MRDEELSDLCDYAEGAVVAAVTQWLEDHGFTPVFERAVINYAVIARFVDDVLEASGIEVEEVQE
jgi:hypothetical protein